MKYAFICLIAFLSCINISFGQGTNADTSNNLNTANGIIQALYNDISGPVGQPRNWNDFKNLFADDARMYIAVTNNNNAPVLKSLTPDDYVNRNQTPLYDIGFTENELYQIANTYGAGTHVFSTYESHYTTKNGDDDITKGINNIQLFFDDTRYYIVSIFLGCQCQKFRGSRLLFTKQ